MSVCLNFPNKCVLKHAFEASILNVRVKKKFEMFICTLATVSSVQSTIYTFPMFEI